MPGKPKRAKKLSDFALRLQAEMTHWGITQSDIALRLGVSQGTVSGWFNRDSFPQPRTLAALGEILGVRPQWLIDGEEPKLNERSQRIGEQAVQSGRPALPPLSGPRHTNATPAEPTRMIKVLSWAQAGMATAFEEIPQDAQEEIPVAVNDPKAFAVRLVGDSMEPRYQAGDVATVLPSIAARNGDLVIANIKEEGFAFKVMSLIGGDPQLIRLTSYNPVYQPMDFQREQFHWIHPVHTVTKHVRR